MLHRQAHCVAPALLAHDGAADRLVPRAQAERLLAAYAGDKHLFRLDETGAAHSGVHHRTIL